MKYITKQDFINLIQLHNKQSSNLDKLSEFGFSIFDSSVIEYGNIMFEKLIDALFTEEGVDWIFWWLYEKNGNPDMKAWDENHNEIPAETIDNLWNIIKHYRK